MCLNKCIKVKTDQIVAQRVDLVKDKKKNNIYRQLFQHPHVPVNLVVAVTRDIPAGAVLDATSLATKRVPNALAATCASQE